MDTNHESTIGPTLISPDVAVARPTPTRRWRAPAAAVAVAAIAVGSISAWQVDAASGGGASSFVPTAPCRLFDTRPGNEPTGGKKSPLGPGEPAVHTQQVTGSVGNCVVPADATAVSMNVTAVNGTAQSNLRVYPADVSRPTASNLNWMAGQSPTPNKVDVQLSPAGAIKLYNQNGTVDVVADIVGYYTPSAIDEMRTRLQALETRQAEQDDEIAALRQTNERLDRAMPFAKTASAAANEDIDDTPTAVLEVELTAPADGHASITYVAMITHPLAGRFVDCNVYRSTDIPADDIDVSEPGVSTDLSDTLLRNVGSLSGELTFEVEAGSTTTFSLACESSVNAVARGRSMTATYTPAS